MSKVTIGVPCNRLIKPETAQSLMALVARGGHEFHICVASEGYTIAENRTYIAVQAVNHGSEYLFFVDDDMVFSPDYLDTLLAHQKDIAGGVYSSRMENSPRQVYRSMDDVVDLRTENLTELTKVIAKGTALMLINTKVFSMPRPWFQFTYNELGQCSEGEDWFFCKKAAEYGFETWVDPILYNGHVGDKVYGVSNTM